MTTEQEEDIDAVSEHEDVEIQEEQEEQQQEEPKQVPLTALQAERRKRQESDARARYLEELLEKSQHQPQQEEEEEDPDGLITRSSYHQDKALTKREILEQLYQEMNPESVHKINTHLKTILDKKPWLAASVDSSVNRLARAAEIVEDYKHLVEEKPKSRAAEAKRIVENSQKPRSPTEIGKSAQPSGTEYLKSIQGKKEFREYRQKILRGEA